MTRVEAGDRLACTMRCRRNRLITLVSAALTLTLLNSIKPLYIDDPVYYHYAAHIAERPLDPYGFEISSQPAMETLAPPLLLYWWAAAIRLFGDRPFLWKVWLLPFCLLFVYSLSALLRRFAAGMEMPLVWMTVLSPAVLPSLNLMLDVPALALSLLALAVFVRAIERESMRLAGMAGLVAGLAAQTKYTALVLPAIILLYAALFRRTSFGLLAVLLAVLVFISWECLITLGYGESHFLYHFRVRRSLSPAHKRIPRLVLPLVAALAGAAPGPALLGLRALNVPRRMLIAAAAMLGLGYALLALVPGHYATFVVDQTTGRAWLTLNNLIFGALGAGVCGTLAGVVRGCCARTRPPVRWLDRLRAHPVEWFLVLWLGLELGGYFALTPFPAVRRVLGAVIAATALVGRFVSGNSRSPTRVPPVRRVLAGAALLGLLFYGVDLRDAFAEKQAVDRVTQLVRARDPSPTIWYAGCCGSQFYAERAGMRPMIPDRAQLRKGDWLAVPADRLLDLQERLARDRTELVATVNVDDFLPLTTKHPYYGGRTPMEHLDGPRVSVKVYRVGGQSPAHAPQ